MPNAIVTGAASGLGAATVRLLVKDGWTVLGLDRVVREVETEVGAVRTVPVDVTDRPAVAAAIAQYAPSAGVDLVANIAGVYPPTTLDTFTQEEFNLVFGVNVLGLLNVTAEASHFLNRGSAIVNLASSNAFDAAPGQLLYNASKAAVVTLTKTLALEFAPRGIRVNGLAPGWIGTEGLEGMADRIPSSASIPLGRLGAPSEVARWIQILAGADASYMTGETIVLSGGSTMR